MRKFLLEIEGLLKVSGQIQWYGDMPVIPPFPVEPPTVKPIIDWNKQLEETGIVELEAGQNYYFPKYKTHKPTKQIRVFCKDENDPATIYFGSENYSEWGNPEEKQDKFLFWSERMEYIISIENVNIFSASKVKEVQPFILTIFGNSSFKDQKAVYSLKNVSTNCEIGILYSGQQTPNQVLMLENVRFNGIMLEELKANNGGGLLSIKRDCEFSQVDPITHFKCEMTLVSNTKINSEISFDRIDNQFNSWGNSCNIVYVNGFTFYLPKTTETGNTHSIRPIPNEGETIKMECFLGSNGIKYFRSKENELQAGDIIEVNGLDCVLEIKDRAGQHHFTNEPLENPVGYWIDYKPKLQDIEIGWHDVKVKKSQALSIIGKTQSGYMIFKYNKHFQTNINQDHGLEYMLASNPFGVLCYNHEEITIDWANCKFNGYYRQSRSGVGLSNYYRVENCQGLGNEFKPPSVFYSQTE